MIFVSFSKKLLLNCAKGIGMCLYNNLNIGAVAAAHTALHGYAQAMAQVKHYGIALFASCNGAAQLAQLIGS